MYWLTYVISREEKIQDVTMKSINPSAPAYESGTLCAVKCELDGRYVIVEFSCIMFFIWIFLVIWFWFSYIESNNHNFVLYLLDDCRHSISPLPSLNPTSVCYLGFRKSVFHLTVHCHQKERTMKGLWMKRKGLEINHIEGKKIENSKDNKTFPQREIIYFYLICGI